MRSQHFVLFSACAIAIPNGFDGKEHVRKRLIIDTDMIDFVSTSYLSVYSVGSAMLTPLLRWTIRLL